MIGQRHRFHGHNSLRGVYQHGQTARGPVINLKFNQRAGNRPYRVAVVVSRKVSKSAVTRNRIRRRIYELVRQTEEELINGLDLVFTVYSEQVASTEPEKLKNIISSLLAKAAK